MKSMFGYTICDQVDASLFKKQCVALETHVTGLARDVFLNSPDGTLIQKYKHEQGTEMVKNDMQIDALYVVSEFDLLPFFKGK